MPNLVVVIRRVGIERLGRVALPGLLHLSFELLTLRLGPILLLGRDQVEPVELAVLEYFKKLLKGAKQSCHRKDIIGPLW